MLPHTAGPGLLGALDVSGQAVATAIVRLTAARAALEPAEALAERAPVQLGVSAFAHGR